MPRRTSFDILDHRPIIANLFVTDVLPTEEFQFRIFGEEVIRIVGRNRTGERLEFAQLIRREHQTSKHPAVLSVPVAGVGGHRVGERQTRGWKHARVVDQGREQQLRRARHVLRTFLLPFGCSALPNGSIVDAFTSLTTMLVRIRSTPSTFMSFSNKNCSR